MNIAKRVERLEREAEAKRPVLPSVVLLVGMDGRACVNGQVYPTAEEAKAAHTSPSGLYVECRTYDARRTPETQTAA